MTTMLWFLGSAMVVVVLEEGEGGQDGGARTRSLVTLVLVHQTLVAMRLKAEEVADTLMALASMILFQGSELLIARWHPGRAGRYPHRTICMGPAPKTGVAQGEEGEGEAEMNGVVIPIVKVDGVAQGGVVEAEVAGDIDHLRIVLLY
jgi:hypothetical protein